jgi:transcription elongation GreA/GreB family factor
MSRAFVKEHDGASGEELPELAVSTHRNLVTRDGLARIEETVARLEAELAEARAGEDTATVARAERDLRYWKQRKSTAEVVPPTRDSDRVRFGSRVTLGVGGTERLSFRIVGEDEADPGLGLISYVSPVAQSLLGAAVGDRVPFRGGEAELLGVE